MSLALIRSAASAIARRGSGGYPARKEQAVEDFAHAALLLAARDMVMAGAPRSAVMEAEDSLRRAAERARLARSIRSVNDAVTAQLAFLFQNLYEIDRGELPLAPHSMARPALYDKPNAARVATIGPSTLTNPNMTAEAQAKIVFLQKDSAARREVRQNLTERVGFSLWIGPSQAPTPTHRAGVYLRGHVPLGTVVALFGGSVYSEEMLMKAVDCGHLANPAVERNLVPRYDGAVLDISAPAVGENLYAVAQHVRHPPPDVRPNVMRVQYDFVREERDGAASVAALPHHLMQYVPNEWGSKVTMFQAAARLMEEEIFMKSMVLITTRDVMDEELFCDARLNPLVPYPSWYTPVSRGRDIGLWQSFVSASPASITA